MADSPNNPANESARIAYLHKCRLLDTPREAPFDSLAELTARLLNTPMSFVNLLDRDRQWFKASVGLAISETPREVAFCDHTLRSGATMQVPDATADSRFRDNPLVVGPPYIRFYTAAPMVTQEGLAIGTVGVLDNRPRQLDRQQIDALELLARQGLTLIEHRKAWFDEREQLIKAADAAMRETDAEYQAIVENSTDMICRFRADGTLTFVNRTYCRMFGRSRDELVGRRFTPVVPEEDRPRVEAVLRSLNPDMTPQTVNHRIVLPDGSIRWCQWTNVAITDDTGDFIAYQAVGTDVTALHNLEEQLRQTQKLESIGRLAAGIAHDFNNLLTVIQGNVVLLEETGAPGDAELLSQVAQAADRAASLTRQLLQFSRKERMERKPLDLNEQVTELTRMLGRILGEDVSLELDLATGLPLVDADAGMLNQVITNLAVNARDAMRRGGTLGIATELVEVSDEQAQAHADARPGRYVRVAVTDNGSGIPADVLPRIFEPFFTTKEAGRGTGLGLSTVYGIIAQHDGWVEVHSAPDRGSTFRLYLPASALTATGSPVSRSERSAGGAETLLVVEDEPGLLALAVRVLENAGYTVLTATNATEGLAVWDSSDGHIDALLTDQVLPGPLRGSELAERCRRENPQLPVVLMSGYAGDQQTEPRLSNGNFGFLQKPFRPRDLLGAVRSVLDSQAG